MQKNIVVFGLGYVGLSCSLLLCDHNTVVGIDVDSKKIDKINSGKSPIKDDLIEQNLVQFKLYCLLFAPLMLEKQIWLSLPLKLIMIQTRMSLILKTLNQL